MILLLAISAAAIFAAHASWPWALAARERAINLPWLERTPRWALAALGTAVIAALAALWADVDRRLVLGDLWQLQPLRFTLVATAGLALGDLVLLLSPAGSRERRGTSLVGVLGAFALFGFCWVFEVARAWGASTPATIASAVTLATAAALLAHPGFHGRRAARLAALATAAALASYAALGEPATATTPITPDGAALRLAPLAAAAALAGAEAFIPHRLRAFCRGLALVLALVALHAAWSEASVSVPFSTQPQPSIPKF